MQAHRDGLRRDKSPMADRWLDCTACMEMTGQAVRASWHCGHLPRRMWRGSGFVAPLKWPKRNGTMCPGYLVRLPEVVEVAQLHSWFAKSQLSLALDGRPLTALCKDSLDALQSAIADVEADMLAPKG